MTVGVRTDLTGFTRAGFLRGADQPGHACSEVYEDDHIQMPGFLQRGHEEKERRVLRLWLCILRRLRHGSLRGWQRGDRKDRVSRPRGAAGLDVSRHDGAGSHEPAEEEPQRVCFYQMWRGQVRSVTYGICQATAKEMTSDFPYTRLRSVLVKSFQLIFNLVVTHGKKTKNIQFTYFLCVGF